MIWYILTFAVIGVIAYKCVKKKREDEEAEIAAYARARSSASSGTSSYSTSAQAVSQTFRAETIEDQSLSQCLARFCGAIDAIRSKNLWRSSNQRGKYMVYLSEDGSYGVYGFYDHDADACVEEALQSGGYLKYMGMEYFTDCVSYKVHGIRNKYGSTDSYFSDSKTADYFRNYFGSSIAVKIENDQKIPDSKTIAFEFSA